MRDVILAQLKQIEAQQRVQILLSVESGSRAWGFASPDSDYDVRFLYLRPQKEYLRLNKTRDVIERPIEENLDINGWDLSKALTLMRTSNPTLFEWLFSPIVYKKTEFYTPLAEAAKHCFNPKNSLYHYLSMAKKTRHEALTPDGIKVKKYCYTLRSLLCCRWILQYNTIPPVPFAQLMETCLPKEVVPAVEHLLAVKKQSAETNAIAPIPVLEEYIKQSIVQTEEQLQQLKSPPKSDWNELNQLFWNALHIE